MRVEGGAGIVEVDVVDNSFSAVIPLELNRINHLFFTAVTADGTTSAPTPAAVTHDSQAPTVFIDFPEDGSEVTNESVDIAGRASDLLSGFMGLDVTVNGQPAEVIVGIGTNGTFERQNVPLVLGPNIIVATAADKKGNTVSKEITINRIAIPEGAPTIVVVTGNGQRAAVNSLLPGPVVVMITKGDGSPFANKLVNFNVIRSNGRLTADGVGKGDMDLQIRTDDGGLAQAFWTLGSDAGCGNNRIEVLSTDIIGTTFFCASADPDLPCLATLLPILLPSKQVFVKSYKITVSFSENISLARFDNSCSIAT